MGNVLRGYIEIFSDIANRFAMLAEGFAILAIR